MRRGLPVTKKPQWSWLKNPLVWVVFVLVAASWDTSYQGRVGQAKTQYHDAMGLVSSQRASCLRGMSNTFTNMEGWYTAYRARLATAEKLHEGPNGVDSISARSYLALAVNQMTRVDAKHSLRWPNPLRVGEKGPFTHPLGYGTFSCESAFPLPKGPHHVSFFQLTGS